MNEAIELSLVSGQRDIQVLLHLTTKLIAKLRDIRLIVIPKPLRLHLLSYAELLQHVDLMLHLLRKLIHNQAPHLRIDRGAVAVEVLDINYNIRLEFQHLRHCYFAHKQVKVEPEGELHAELLRKVEGFIERVPFLGFLDGQ